MEGNLGNRVASPAGERLKFPRAGGRPYLRELWSSWRSSPLALLPGRSRRRVEIPISELLGFLSDVREKVAWTNRLRPAGDSSCPAGRQLKKRLPTQERNARL